MINELIKRNPELGALKEKIENAKNLIIKCYENSGKLLLCGNGGSSADCDHIVGELMKGFIKTRPLDEKLREEMKKKSPSLDDEILTSLQSGLPAISLTAQTALTSAFSNDIDPSLVFAQQVLALGKAYDILICLSTSGNSGNVVNAAKIAKALDITVISLTGDGGGKLKELSDVCISVPRKETFLVQELHLPIYHYLCAAVEEHFFKN